MALRAGFTMTLHDVTLSEFDGLSMLINEREEQRVREIEEQQRQVQAPRMRMSTID